MEFITEGAVKEVSIILRGPQAIELLEALETVDLSDDTDIAIAVGYDNGAWQHHTENEEGTGCGAHNSLRRCICGMNMLTTAAEREAALRELTA